MTTPFANKVRVSFIGSCAVGYAVKAVLTKHPFKAVGAVVANDIDIELAFRSMRSGKAPTSAICVTNLIIASKPVNGSSTFT